MVQSGGDSASGGGRPPVLLFVLVGLGLLVAGYLVLGGGAEDEPAADAIASPGGAEPELAARVEGVPATQATAAPDDSPGARSDRESESPEARSQAQIYHEAGEAPPIEPIPPRILEEFQRGTAAVSDERRELMERGREEMPDHIRRDFEEAANPNVPTEIRDDFENPYPPMPPGHEEYFPNLQPPSRSDGADGAR